MTDKRWMWRSNDFPMLVQIVNGNEFNWSQVESAGGYENGILLVTCSALSIAEESLESSSIDSGADDIDALKVLESWLHNSTEENFRKISDVLYAEDDKAEPVSELSGPVFWALRCALSHPDGCGEIDWAMEGLYDVIIENGFSRQWFGKVALAGLKSRMIKS